MALDVTLATNRLILKDGTVPRSSITYINIIDIQPIQQPVMNYGEQPPTVISQQWVLRMRLKTGKQQDIELGSLASQATWTNNAAGYAIAEAAIYAAFP